MAKVSKKPKMGRPKIEIDIRQLKSFMRLSPNLKDTADFFDVSEDKIEDLIKENWNMSFPEFRDKNAVHSRMGIKRKMIEKAMAGDNTMLIWLSKNMLGMSDKVETKHSGQIDQKQMIESPQEHLDRIKAMLKDDLK